jgi:hypothetical protein
MFALGLFFFSVSELITICPDAYTAAEKSHALVVLTEWDEFAVSKKKILKNKKGNQNQRPRKRPRLLAYKELGCCQFFTSMYCANDNVLIVFVNRT